MTAASRTSLRADRGECCDALDEAVAFGEPDFEADFDGGFDVVGEVDVIAGRDGARLGADFDEEGAVGTVAEPPDGWVGAGAVLDGDAAALLDDAAGAGRRRLPGS